MKAVAYCRVSTNKEEQLDSLESQQTFFAEYARRNGLELIHIYADEGKSGTNMKNRTELLRLLTDARTELFETVLIKDVSRLARNTLDFLTSIRSLKALGIKVVFVNYDQTSSDSSEFMLTMLSAIAQEESANTSKRVKFGKRQNAEKGKVPNLVFGYDKIIGEYFRLDVNQEEAEVVRRIYHLYAEDNIGANRIANILNQEGIKTKRNCKWTQTAVARILNNPIYIGKIVNGKQEVEDFLTGKRKALDKKHWMLVENLELKIIEEDIFYKAQKILSRRQEVYNKTKKRISEKYVFSQLITCRECGSSYRRLVRRYKNTYITWVCNGRNSNGVDFCNNQITIDEDQLLLSIVDYFIKYFTLDTHSIKVLIKEIKYQLSKNLNYNTNAKDINTRINKLKKEKEKYMDMYTNEIISLEELKEKAGFIQKSIEYYQTKLNSLMVSIGSLCESRNNAAYPYNITSLLEEGAWNLEETLKQIIRQELFTNNMLKKIIEGIEVKADGNIDVYIKAFKDELTNKTI